jgi:ribose transport system ATP-binding protein
MSTGVGASAVGLWKTYGATPVLKGVDLAFHAGRVHALLGPNGAGKSTLLGCLSGATQPDAGVIEVGGVGHAGFTPTTALDAGVAIIYQHVQLISDLTVAENVFLGQELTSWSRQVKVAEQNEVAGRLLHELGLAIDVTLPLSRLSIGEQQIVAIARALRHEPSTLILDEPTAALSEAEVAILLDLVRRLAREKQMTIIYVTHLLREVLVVADEVSVLRDGSVLWTKPIEELDLGLLVQAIAPAPLGERPTTDRPGRGKVLLELDAYASLHAGPFSLDVHSGEIIGVFGLLGSGRTDLLEGLAGIRSSRGGVVRFRGRDLDLRSPRAAQSAGVALVPSDRQLQALFMDLAAIENVLMPNYSRLSRWWRRRAAERKVFAEVAGHVGLEPADPGKSAANFSGGNAQKIAVGRWLTGLDATAVLLLDEPTQGVDVGARKDIYQLLRNYVTTADRAVVFASSDAEEIVALADTVLVLVDGLPVGVVSPQVGETALIELAHSESSALAQRS